LCGAVIEGWAIFLELEFTGREPADCRRCEQLVRKGGQGGAGRPHLSFANRFRPEDLA
jgi:hypothetical protein